MKKRDFPIFSLTVILALFGCIRPAAAEEEWRAGLETITAEELSSMVYFLASDEMEGRDTGTLANRISSQYLAHQLELLGLEPLEGSDDYFQYLTLLRSRLEDANRLEFRRGDSPLREVGVLLDDFFPANISASGRVTAPLDFVGYGLTAPELDFDEYGGIDTDAKVVVLFTGLPESDSESEPFASKIRTDYSSDLYKVENAQSHGAVGVILVHVGEWRSFSSSARNMWPEDEESGPFVAKFDVDQIKIPVIYCTEEKISSLLRDEEDLKGLREEIGRHRQPRSRPLKAFEATLETQIARRENRVRNVLAYLPGSDPVLKKEVVIVSAHFDHVGKGAGKIYNGADDDASGTAGVLEIAEAFAVSVTKPKRSTIFALWNAEEKGLFGSRYFAEHPPVALNQTVALLQLDMIGRNQQVDDPEDRRFRGLEKQTADENENTVHLIGYSHSDDLRELTRSSNEAIGLELKYELDQHPLNIIRRSDHWPFLTKDVPAFLLTTGFHPDYHTAGDTADRINYPKMERIVRLSFLCAWHLANSDSRPQLNKEGEG